MSNRFRGIKDWSEIPRTLAQRRLNFDYNPNVAPSEQVPAFLAERGKAVQTRMTRFAGIQDYSDVQGDTMPSFAISTDEPNEWVAPYHDRMPVVIDAPETWLNVESTCDDIALLAPNQFEVRRSIAL